MDKFVYQEEFYRESDAQIILSLLFSNKIPSSVIDIGCGTGTWLRVAKQLGVQSILGFDASSYDEAKWHISKDEYVCTDIGKEIIFPSRANICFCLEVAEHIEEANAIQLIKNLVSASDVILFSAAIPGQGGQNHINENWPTYWEEIFNNLGYICYDYLRPAIWQNNKIHFWYRQNILLFIKEGTTISINHPKPKVLSAIHPELYDNLLKDNFALRQTIKELIWFPDLSTGIRIFLKSLLGIFKRRQL